MKTLDRITFNQEVMGGKPCIRGLRVTVGTIVGLIAAGRTKDEVLKLYPYLRKILIKPSHTLHGELRK